MNKAFVKEQEDHGDRCPACGSIGTQVSQATVASQLVDPDDVAKLSQSPCFCPLPNCDVTYFDGFERTLSTDDLRGHVYPKSPTAPICPCFGLTCEEVEEAAISGDVAKVKAHLQRTDSDEASCETKSPTGKSCAVDIQKLFISRY